MRILSFLTGFIYLAAFFSASLAQEDSMVPQIEVEATFPESNPFGHIVNGEKNKLKLLVENKSDLDVTLLSVGGAIRHATTEKLIQNTTVMSSGVRLLTGVKVDLTYAFHSEFKPGDVRLNVWLEHMTGESRYRVTAFDSIVTVVEPEKSLLDLKLILTYIMVIGLFGGIIYVSYIMFFPQPKRPRRKQAAAVDVSTPVSVTGAGTGGYQEEWIPEHHLKKSKKDKAVGVVSSEGETSGADSVREVRKRRGRK